MNESAKSRNQTKELTGEKRREGEREMKTYRAPQDRHDRYSI